MALPDPWGAEPFPEEAWRVFDPTMRRYADVPLIRVDGQQIVIVRAGAAALPEPDRLLACIAEEEVRARQNSQQWPESPVLGVFANDLGGLGVVPVGWWVSEDWRWVHYLKVDDVTDGPTIADLLRIFVAKVELLARADAAGWEYHARDGAELTLVLPTYPTDSA